MSRRLHPHNTAKLRDQAPNVVEAALYLDELLAMGHKLTVRIRVGTIDVSAETFVGAVLKVRRNRERNARHG